MKKNAQYIPPVTEVFHIKVENVANMNPLSGTNVSNTGEGDNRDRGSIGLDNSGEFGGITPGKRQSLWDDDDDL